MGSCMPEWHLRPGSRLQLYPRVFSRPTVSTCPPLLTHPGPGGARSISADLKQDTRKSAVLMPQSQEMSWSAWLLGATSSPSASRAFWLSEPTVLPLQGHWK